MATMLLGRLKTIADAVIDLSNDASQKLATDARLLRYINACIADVAKTGYWKTTGTLSLVAGTASYPFSTTFPTFLSLERGGSAVRDSTTNIPLILCSTRHDYNNVLLRVATGTPRYYYHESNALYLAPVPEAALDLLVSYTYKPTAVSSRDLKETATHWVQDSGATGHFVDDTSTAQTLGEGNDCPEIVEGLAVELTTGTFTISSITPDGEGSGEVTLSAASVNATVNSIYDSTLTSPPWPDAYDDGLAAFFCLWKIFSSDSTHTASDKSVATYGQQYLRELNSMVGAALPPIVLRPYR